MNRMSHEDALNLAYGAIAKLRFGEGKKRLSVMDVASVAGIARSTFYTQHRDWVEIRDVIVNNKPSPRLKLAAVDFSEQKKWQRDAGRLQQELENCRDELSTVKEKMEQVYKRLLQQLQNYAIKSIDSRHQNEEQAAIAEQLTETRRELEAYKQELHRVRNEPGLSSSILPLVNKKVIQAFDRDMRTKLLTVSDLHELSTDSLMQLDDHFAVSGSVPTAVYVLTGNFATGKSSWIKKHRPLNTGTSLYIDGINHTSALRTLAVKRVKKLDPACRVVCVRFYSSLDSCIRRNNDEERLRNGLAVIESVIRLTDEIYEEVGLTEGFDAIEIIRGEANG